MGKKVLGFVEIVVGSALTAMAFGLIVLRLGFVAGGVTGLGVILHQWVPLPDRVHIRGVRGARRGRLNPCKPDATPS